jgi:hypothetical protein
MIKPESMFAGAINVYTPMSSRLMRAIRESVSTSQRGFTHGTDSTGHDRPGDADGQ